MKKIFSLAAIALAFFATSCSKDKNENTGSVSTEKKLKHTTLNEDRTFTYNADGTLKEANIPNGYKEVLIYEPGKVIIESRSNGALIATFEFTLTNGKPIKGTWSNLNDMGQPTDITVYLYEYNAKGLLKRVTYENSDYEEYEYDVNDDLIRLTYVNQGIADGKIEFTYGNQEDRFPQYSVIKPSTENFLFPALSKHLPVSRKEINLPQNNTTHHLTYTYELDAQGYVVKGNAASQTPNSSGYSWTNTY
jgi:hypothetical protein